MKDYTGIHLYKATGNVLESDPQYIEVFIPNVDHKAEPFLERTYARPCYAFGDISAPSQAWLERYQDEILICVMFEEGNPSIPMWIGYTPTTALSDVPEDFPNGYIKKTEKFFIKIDDANGEMYIAYRNGTNMMQAIKMVNDTTTLGKASSSKEPALLGDTSVSLLDDLISAIQAMSFTVTVGSSSGTTVTLNNLATFTTLAARLESLKSKSIKLD